MKFGLSDVTIMVNNVFTLIRDKDEVKVSDVLDYILPYVREEDFILKKNYKIKTQVHSVFGKWPQTYGNAYFIDSKFLLQDGYDMFKNNVQKYLLRNNFAQKDIDFVEDYFGIMKKGVSPKTINQFSLNIMGHLENRMHTYVYDKTAFNKVLNRIFELISLDSKYKS